MKVTSGVSKFCGDPEKLAVIWDALRVFPTGASAKQLAKKLGWSATVASQRLGRLAMYDIIDRVPHPTERGYRYSVRRHAHA